MISPALDIRHPSGLDPESTSPSSWQLLLAGATLRVAIPTALVVGTLLTVVNQASAVTSGQATAMTYLRVAFNYWVPFAVSSFGYLRALRIAQANSAADNNTLRLSEPDITDRLADADAIEEQSPSADDATDAPEVHLAAQRRVFADSVGDAREALERMTDRAEANFDRARSASGASGQAGELVRESRTELDQMLGAVSDMIEASRHINDVLTTVSGVAEKTNLLALNATIEAARAGEAGRGFAVVAGEVKNLSVQSSTSVGESREVVTRVLETLSVVEVSSASIAERFSTLSDRLHEIDELTGAIAEAAGAQPATVESILSSLRVATEEPEPSEISTTSFGPGLFEADKLPKAKV
jgi:methyl-accepting chemotaxis protein